MDGVDDAPLDDSVTEAERHVILEQLNALEDRIGGACGSSGRPRGDVRLLLATKTVPVERIRVAIEAGNALIGENRVQEVVAKGPGLADLEHTTHFIGHLQKNKVNQVLPWVQLIQSIDRVEIAEAVSKRLDRPLNVFVQVNTSGEPSKYGVDPDAAVELAEQVDELPNLSVRGFMTIGLFSTDEVPVRRCYERLRIVRDQAVSGGLSDAVELSMGMSGDLEWAIAEGSTMVRVGSAVFGARPTSDAYYWPGSAPEV